MSSLPGVRNFSHGIEAVDSVLDIILPLTEPRVGDLMGV